jgi:hypothetical protein
MQLRTSISCGVLLAGLAAIAVPTGGALAARHHVASAISGPVCAMRADGPKYYLTAKAAMADSARVMHPGDCEAVVCSGAGPKIAMNMGLLPSHAICGMDPLSHQRMTYPNDCAIEAAGATWIHAGPCK